MATDDPLKPIVGEKTTVKRRIRLLSLPIVIQKEFFQQMDTFELVEFSLLSKRMKLLVAFCTPPIEKIELAYTSVRVERNSSLMDFSQGSDPEEKESRTIGGSDFRSWKYNDLGLVSFNCDNAEDVLHIYHHLCDIFRPEENNYDFAGGTNEFIEDHMKNVPREVDELKIGNESDEDQTKLDTILDYCEVKDRLVYFGELNHLHRKMSITRSVFFRIVRNLPLIQFLSLQSENIFIRESMFETKDFVDFINAWKASHWKCKNFTFTRGKINMREALKLVDAQPYDNHKKTKCDPEAENLSPTRMCIERNDGKLSIINHTPIKLWVSARGFLGMFEFRLV